MFLLFRTLKLVLLLLPIMVTGGEPKSDPQSQIDAIMAGAGVGEHTPGAAVIVLQDGRKLFEKGYGLAQLAPEIPIRPHTSFELASCSKQFTAMAIMILAERGKLKFEDHLVKFFPEFENLGRQITILHLLHHTSALPDYMNAWGKAKGGGEVTSRRMLHMLSKETKLRFAPGEKYEYSNSGYMVLAQIVEKASGRKYPEFLKENIFDPLGMADSIVFDETKPRIPHRALCYALNGNEWKNTSQSELNAVYGDGSVRSPVEDLAKWDQALYSEKLVKAEMLKRAFTEGRLNDGSGTGYGFGWGIGEFRKIEEISHDGSWLDFRTIVLRLPEKKLSVIILANCSTLHVGEMAHKIAALFLKPGAR